MIRLKMTKSAIVDTLLMDVQCQLKENGKKEYISIGAAIKHFTSLNLELVDIMSLKNEKKKKFLVIKILKDKKK